MFHTAPLPFSWPPGVQGFPPSKPDPSLLSRPHITDRVFCMVDWCWYLLAVACRLRPKHPIHDADDIELCEGEVGATAESSGPAMTLVVNEHMPPPTLAVSRASNVGLQGRPAA